MEPSRPNKRQEPQQAPALLSVLWLYLTSRPLTDGNGLSLPLAHAPRDTISMLKKRRPTDSGAPGSNQDSRGSKKRRVVNCVMILLDVAKESADWFPPLKSALGGVNALITHYEQFKEVKEKIEDLIPQLDRLKEYITTTTVDGDPEETDRRKKLASTFDQVEKESQKLLAKNAVTRFVEKGEDSQLVVTLIERLREGILSYQISQQQTIYSQITHLTSSFDALLKLQEKPPAVGIKLESVVAQLDRLKDSPWKKLRHERWAKLIDVLKPIRDKAKGIYEHITREEYVENAKDVLAVSGLAEDLRNVLLEYWIEQQQEVYDQGCRLIDAADLSVLNSCRRTKGAEYRHGNRRGCLKGTRDTVLNEIESWTKDFDQSPVFWLNGLAGTGKSTIAQTTAECLFAEGRLGASFFCSRDFEDRSDLHFIFPTIAFQLAYKYPDFRSYFVSLLLSNPDVAHESLSRQMQKLIVEPLRTTGVSMVIVIDALDECKDNEPSSAILSVLGRFVGKIPRVKFFITGRPEPRIQTGFRLPLLIDLTDGFVLHDVQQSLINSDIRLFLKHELSELAQRRRLGQWPNDEHIDLLCQRAAGFFVYAVATVKFLDSNTHPPRQQLDDILKLPENTAPEGKTRLSPKTTLDSLYTSILQAAFDEEDPDVDSKVRATIGTLISVVNPLPPLAISELVGLDPEQVMLFLTLIQSLLAIEDPNQPVKPFHKSFPDFIADPSRCTNPRFRLSTRDLQLGLAAGCMRVMNGGLEKNILSLPEYALNSEVGDLREKLDDRVSVALRYACRSWHRHVIKTGEIAEITPHLLILLEVKFLEWLEVLSLLGEVGGAVVALGELVAWLQTAAEDKRLLNISRDCFNFVTKFFEPINASALHIYHSALELCPTSSIVRKLYYPKYNRVTHLPRVVTGTPSSWDPTVSTSSRERSYESCTWSPCGRFIAAQTRNAVEIRNQLTLEPLPALQPPESVSRLTGPFAYSSDGRSLACVSNSTIILWDIQTGVVVKEIACGPNVTSMVWSLDGKTIGVIGGESGRGLQTYVGQYDAASGLKVFAEELRLGENTCIWAGETSFRATTVMKNNHGFCTSLEIETFELGSTLTRIHSCSFKCIVYLPGLVTVESFSPTTCRVSISIADTLRICGNEYESCLLIEPGRFSSPCFSPDGGLFAASGGDGVQIWEYCRGYGYYLPYRKFCRQDWANFSIGFSPAPLSIVGHSGSTLCILRVDGLPDSPETRSRQCVTITRSGNRIATTHESRDTITIIDAKSRATLQLLGTDLQIEGLFCVGNTLLAINATSAAIFQLSMEGLSCRPPRYIEGRRVPDAPSEMSGALSFSVEGQILLVKSGADTQILAYDTETGEALSPAYVPQNSSRRWYRFDSALGGRHYPHLQNLPQRDIPPEGDRQTPQITLREGWAKDSEGRCRLWVPVEWRMSWDHVDWLRDIATQFSYVAGEPIIVKF